MSFGEPLMASELSMPATTRFEDATEKWWAGWREQHMSARSYGRYETPTVLGRFFKKYSMLVLLVIGAVFALLYYAVGMTLRYISDEVVAPRVQYRKMQRARNKVVKQLEREMVHSDLE